MAEKFDEIMEDLKHERFEQFIRKWGANIVILALFVALMTAAFNWYTHNRDNNRMETGEKFRQAQLITDAEKASALLDDVMKNGSDGYKQLAAIKKAADLTKGGKKEEAKKLYESVMNDSGADIVLKDFAGLMLASDMVEKNDEGAKEILNKLVAEGRPWRFLAMEQKAMYELQNNNKQDAASIFYFLTTDEAVPDGIRMRAEKMWEMVK